MRALRIGRNAETASSSAGTGESEREIRLVDSGDGRVATDVETGVTSQGATREAAPENLDEAVALHRGEIGRPPTEEELREPGIDPEDDVTGDREPPSVLDRSGWLDGRFPDSRSSRPRGACPNRVRRICRSVPLPLRWPLKPTALHLCAR